MKPQSPLVSLIVRTKDRPKLLRDALRSVNTQTYRPLQVVVVNDGGAPLDRESLGGLLREVDLQFLELAENRGRARAGNAGLEACQGRYVGFLDDDDVLLPEHVALLTACLEGGAHRVCYGDAELCERSFDPERRHFVLETCRLFSSLDFSYPELLQENHIPLICLLFDREILTEAGGFDPEFEVYEDWDLLLRVGRSHPFYHVPQVTARYVQWSRELQIGQTEHYQEQWLQNHRRLLAKHSKEFTPELVKHVLGTRKDLQREVETRRSRAVDLEAEARRAWSRLSEVEQELQKSYQALEKAEAVRARLEEQLGNARQEADLARGETQAVRAHAESSENQLQAITSSRAWRWIQRYGRLRGHLLPWHASRGGVPQKAGGGLPRKIKRAVQIARHEGISGVQRRVNRSVLFPKSVKQEDYPFVALDERQVSIEAVPGLLDVSVTVVIPTRNAGPDFPVMLDKIRRQWGVASVDLLVLDSGSGDRTLACAQQAGATVVTIPPAKFHHAETRNLALQHASGEILVFLVQDALPVGHDWLYRLVQPLLEGAAAAVSVRPLPRTDADLFALWSSWGYMEYLGFKSDSVRGPDDEPALAMLAPADRRRRVVLDSVCLGIRRALLDELKFQGAYGEDIDLGKRVLDAGHTLLYQVSNAVIHSHRRSAEYFFRRAYIDNLHLADILHLPRDTHATSAVLATVAHGYAGFSRRLADWADQLAGMPKRPSLALRELGDSLKRALHARQRPEAPGDPGLLAIFEAFPREEVDDQLLTELEERLYWSLVSLSEFLESSASWYSPLEEVVDTLHKCYAISAGCYVAMAGAELDPQLLQGI